jgi:hypothetical protein
VAQIKGRKQQKNGQKQVRFSFRSADAAAGLVAPPQAAGTGF